MSDIGPRFSGGHQFMRGDAVSLRREPPVKQTTEIGPYRATVSLVPLTGGRPTWDVCALWTHPVNGSVSQTRILHDEGDAWRYFWELEDALRDPGPADEILRRAIGDG